MDFYKHFRQWIGTQSRQSAKLSFSRRNWDFPNPSPAGECAPSLWYRGGSTLACERGGGGVPIPTRGHKLWYCTVYIYICTLWIGSKITSGAEI